MRTGARAAATGRARARGFPLVEARTRLRLAGAPEACGRLETARPDGPIPEEILT